MKRFFVLILAACLLLPSLVCACSDFRVKAEDGSVVIGRSMEFPIDLKSEVCIVPRGNAKYAFLGINAYQLADTFVDGFNEKGLSLDGLMFTGAEYQTEGSGQTVAMDELGAWALGNFATVAEVKAAIPTIRIVAAKNKKLKDLGMHLAFHDAAGKSLVVEFIGGKVNVYDNPLGVMTNRPDFPWQLNNLRNYVNLDSHDKDSKMVNGVKIESTGVGSGLHGLPGDWTPPSRFVKLAFCVDAALPVKDAAGAVNLAEHILNTVDIPKGLIKEGTEVPTVELYGIAQWTIIKDLTNKVLYYKTYDNTAWRSVDLKKFDLSPGAPRKSLAIAAQIGSVIDVSGHLK
ncbi:MAG: choloylglycine hydrolase family protein [Candidatus Margulisbacteria bacterium]|nr:choloylglycine hydrolase family protein [Candidatus Margulisiibacteriota bacterium]